MTKLTDLPYPLRLCTELLHFAAWGCTKTQDKTATEIKLAASQFFDEAMIEEATAILCGKSTNTYPCQHTWTDLQNQVIESGQACLKCGKLRE